MRELVSGVIVMADLVAALLFLRSWRATRDRLFLYFTAAFAMLAVPRALLSVPVLHGEIDLLLYALRAAAYLVLAAGIVDKNRRAR